MEHHGQNAQTRDHVGNKLLYQLCDAAASEKDTTNNQPPQTRVQDETQQKGKRPFDKTSSSARTEPPLKTSRISSTGARAVQAPSLLAKSAQPHPTVNRQGLSPQQTGGVGRGQPLPYHVG